MCVYIIIYIIKSYRIIENRKKNYTHIISMQEKAESIFRNIYI